MVDELSPEHSENFENARAEYAATHAAYIHYDDYTWKVGTVLIAGVFIFWGFLLDKRPDLYRVFLANTLVCAILSVWALYGAHNRQLYRYKLHRLHELEAILGMKQHLRFVTIPAEYPLTGFRGHNLNIFTYVIAAFGGLFLGLFPLLPGLWTYSQYILLALNILLVFSTLRRIKRVSDDTDVAIKKLNIQINAPTMKN